jgi:hypothetical protein
MRTCALVLYVVDNRVLFEWDAKKNRANRKKHALVDVWNKPLTERQKAALDSVAKRQKKADSPQIDYSDIPALTDKQLGVAATSKEVGGA